jgi:hypothetical protein
MLGVRRLTVEVTARYHPTGNRFLTREYTKNGERRTAGLDGQPVTLLSYETYRS